MCAAPRAPSLAVSISFSLSVGPEFSITFPSQAGFNYVLEYKNSLNDPTWTPLSPPVAGTGSMMSLPDTNGLVTSRYYRVQRQ